MPEKTLLNYILQQLTRYSLKFLAFSLTILAIAYSCKKDDDFNTDKGLKLQLYTDTVHFDTIFTKVGSATKNFKVKNPAADPVKIDFIRLAGGEKSSFRINIDGRATANYENYELAAGDSLYIFVEVTIDPNNAALPFVVMDSIEFRLNGNYQRVVLDAFGQNAHFLENEYVECNAIWTNDKPYVIYRSIGIAAGCKLTIEKGTKIYSHRGSGILVEGTLEVNGTKDEPVLFQSDRLEPTYKDQPGQWYGIRFFPKSNNNKLTHAIIQNGLIGLEADSLPLSSNTMNLQLEKCDIRNMTVAGLVGYSATVDARNCLFYNCGQYAFVGDLGGKYTFTHCTFDGHNSSVARQEPLIALSNADYKDLKGNITINDLSASFRNCIIWGSLDDEVGLSKEGKGKVDTLFRNNIIKTLKMKYGNANILNKAPRFKNDLSRDYHLDTLSPAKDAGKYFDEPFKVTDDKDNAFRDAKPDLGCFERTE